MDKIKVSHQYTVEGYITFRISVINGDFAGASNFCISQILLKECLVSMKEMYGILSGTCQMNDYDSDDYIRFEISKIGHLTISGQVGGSQNEQFLRYQLYSDQTVLGNLISDFGFLLKQ